MLPTKYATSSRSNVNNERSSFGASANAPPLGITGVLCSNQTVSIERRGTLHYTVYRPRMLSPIQLPPASSNNNTSSHKIRRSLNLPQPNPPLICIAGGPGMPCQYLTSLVHLIADRAIVIYDHIGVGQSKALNASVLQQTPIIQGMVNERRIL